MLFNTDRGLWVLDVDVDRKFVVQSKNKRAAVVFEEKMTVVRLQQPSRRWRKMSLHTAVRHIFLIMSLSFSGSLQRDLVGENIFNLLIIE